MWYNKYIGIPYKDGGRNQDGLDCWGLLRLVYKEQYNIDIPSFKSHYTTAKDTEQISELIARNKELWEATTEPVEGSGVLLRINGAETHVGVYLGNGMLLHVMEGTHAVIEPLTSVKWKHRVVGYFNYKQNSSALVSTVGIPNPLKTERITIPVVVGTNLKFLADWVASEYSISDKIACKTIFMVNGKVIEKELWESTILSTTDSVEYRVLPEGGDGFFKLIAFVFVAYIAIQTGMYVGGTGLIESGLYAGSTALGYGSFAAFAVQTGIMLAGSALINAIAPIRPPSMPQQADPGSAQAQNLINGANNQPMQYGAIPVVLGKMRVTPPIGATNYVHFSGDASSAEIQSTAGVSGRDTFVDMLLIWGYGPLHIDTNTLRIGQVNVYNQDGSSNYTNLKAIHLDRISETTTNNLLSAFNAIYGRDVQQHFPNQPLTYPGLPPTASGAWTPQPSPTSDTGWVEYGFSQPSESISVAISFPQGLRAILIKGEAGGTSYAAPVGFQIQYKVGATGAWTNWNTEGRYNVGGQLAKGTEAYSYDLYGYWGNSWEETYGYGYQTIFASRVQNEVLGGGPIKDAFTWTVSLDRQTTVGGNIITATRWNQNDLIQVRIRRITGDDTEPGDYRYSHAATLQSVTSYNNANPAVDPPNSKLAKSAISIQATDEINGQIDGINAIVQTVCKDWDTSTQTWIERATSNPASLYRYVLQHPANPQPVLDSQLDLSKLQHWHEYCNQSRTVIYSYNNVTQTITGVKLQYNSVMGGSQRGVLEVLRDICAAGRASPAMVDGRWSVVIDEPKASVIQHFTPHNSWGFEATKLLPRMPEALKVQYNDRDAEYVQKEIIVGYADTNVNNAQLLESIQLPGVTSTGEAIDHARWHLAQIKLRPEVYTINTDIEYIVCNRGDRVKVTHDVPMWGLGSGRIKNTFGTSNSNITVLELDEAVTIDSTKSHTIRVRNSSNGDSATYSINKSFNIAQTSRTANIVTIKFSAIHPLNIGDVVVVNSSNSAINTNLATVKSIVYDVYGAPIGFTYSKTGASFTLVSTSGTVSLTTNFYKSVQLSTPTTTTLVAPTDLFLFGELNNESQDLIVTKIEPTTNKTARLTLVDYGITQTYNIFTDYVNISNNAIFEAQVTQPPIILINQVGNLKPSVDINKIISDERVIRKVAPGVYEYSMLIPYTNPPELSNDVGSVMLELIHANMPDTSGGRTFTIDLATGSFTIDDVQELEVYRFRLRYVTKSGRIGPWTEWYGHQVVGKTTPPSSVIGFNYDIVFSSGLVQLTWTPNTEIDISKYEVRTTDSGWGTPGYTYNGALSSCTVIVDGTSQVFYIKAIDANGLYSTLASQVTVVATLPSEPSAISYSFGSTSTTGSSITFTWPTPSSGAYNLNYYKVALSKPGFSAIVDNVYSNSWTTDADWLGTASISITTVDVRNRQSTASKTISVLKERPVAPLTATFNVVEGYLELDWEDSVKTTLPIAGYEVRKDNLNSSWGVRDSNFIWKGNTSKTNITSIVAGINTVYVNAYDTDGRYDENGTAFSYTVTAASQVSGFVSTYTTAISGSNLTLRWTGNKGTFDIQEYIVTITKPVGYESITARISANTWTTAADWIGTSTVSITPVDKAGISGATYTTTIAKALPSSPAAPTITIKDRSLNINWLDVERSAGGMPVAGYELRSISNNWGTAGALWRGSVSEVDVSSFVTGTNTWYLATYDTDGKYSAPTTVTYTVNNPQPATGFSYAFADTSSTAATVNVSWTAPATTYFAVDYYEIIITKPGPITEVVNIKSNLITLPVNWTGTADFSIRTVDITGRKSNALPGSITKSRPSAPASYTTQTNTTGSVTFTWPKAVAGSLPIAGYELRAQGTLPGTDDFVWRGSANSLTISKLVLGSNTWNLWSFDTDGEYSQSALSVSYTVVAPSAATGLVHEFSTNLTGATCLFKWQPPITSVFGIKEYKVQFSYSAPNTATIASTRNSTDWEIAASWTGVGTLSIIAVDNLLNESIVASYTVTKYVPNTIVDVTTSIAGTGLELDWPNIPQTSLPVIGYELRTADTNWGISGALWKGSTSSTYVELYNQVTDSDTFPYTLTYYLRAYDTDGKYSAASRVITKTITRPQDITKVGEPDFADTSLTSATVTIRWTAATPEFGLRGYRVIASGVDVVINSTEITLPVNWLGIKNFTVKVVDNLGIQSAGIIIPVERIAPNPPSNFRAQVVDNNVLLYWTLPARTTLPIAHVEIRKGATWAGGEVIGNKDGTFTTISELRGGEFTYHIATVDTEGQASDPISQVVQVSQPPDFVFNAEYTFDYISPNTTLVNAKQEANTGALVLPVNLTETFSQHFTTRAWDQPIDQVNAGYPIYIQPGITTGYYEQVFDYGTVLGSSQITVTLDYDVLAGNPVLASQLSISLDGVSYTTYDGLSVFASNFRYIKYKLQVTQNAIGDLVRINTGLIRLDAKQKSDSGSVSALSTDTAGTIVNFGKEIIDVTSITLTSAGTVPRVTVYDFKDAIITGTYSVTSGVATINATNHELLAGQKVRLTFTSGTANTVSGVYTIASVINANSYTVSISTSNTSGNVTTYPNSMRVYLFDNAGTRQSGTVSWNLRGY